MPEKRRQKHERIKVNGHNTVISLDVLWAEASRDNQALTLWVLLVFLDKEIRRSTDTALPGVELFNR
jgi:hypothetical protein